MTSRQAVLEKGKAITRAQVEDFLFFEAELLDQWRLTEWESLLTDDAVYQIPSNDCPEGSPRASLFIIADDRERIHQRILRILSPDCHAEYPKSRTQRMISNVRIAERDGSVLKLCSAYRVRVRLDRLLPTPALKLPKIHVLRQNDACIKAAQSPPPSTSTSVSERTTFTGSVTAPR